MNTTGPTGPPKPIEPLSLDEQMMPKAAIHEIVKAERWERLTLFTVTQRMEYVVEIIDMAKTMILHCAVSRGYASSTIAIVGNIHRAYEVAKRTLEV